MAMKDDYLWGARIHYRTDPATGKKIRMTATEEIEYQKETEQMLIQYGILDKDGRALVEDLGTAEECRGQFRRSEPPHVALLNIKHASYNELAQYETWLWYLLDIIQNRMLAIKWGEDLPDGVFHLSD